MEVLCYKHEYNMIYLFWLAFVLQVQQLEQQLVLIELDSDWPPAHRAERSGGQWPHQLEQMVPGLLKQHAHTRQLDEELRQRAHTRRLYKAIG